MSGFTSTPTGPLKLAARRRGHISAAPFSRASSYMFVLLYKSRYSTGDAAHGNTSCLPIWVCSGPKWLTTLHYDTDISSFLPQNERSGPH